MNGSIAKCPFWLSERLKKIGGSTSFYQFMDWSLNDPDFGAYSTGILRIGKRGDFCTSPSLGDEFARLLAAQIIDWFSQLVQKQPNYPMFSLVEFGPGEGYLVRDLIKAIKDLSPQLIDKIEIVFVEINNGMRLRQKEIMIQEKSVRIRWVGIDELKRNPIVGVVIANEVLDAFPVERIIFRDNNIFRQGIKLLEKEEGNYITFCDLEPTKSIRNFIKNSEHLLGVKIPPLEAPNGWCTEWHCDLISWFHNVYEAVNYGPLLVIDYALESKRYYHESRSSGTLISYYNQNACSNILRNAGRCDLTSHLCLESIITSATNAGWGFLGETRQGQALLALGLSNLLYSLQKLGNDKIEFALEKRESLLRLVDPLGLGEFRWFSFQKNDESRYPNDPIFLKSIFLEEPPM